MILTRISGSRIVKRLVRKEDDEKLSGMRMIGIRIGRQEAAAALQH